MDTPKRRGRPAGGLPTHKRTVAFPAGLYAKLERIAKREERTVNDLIVTVLREMAKSEPDAGNRAPTQLAATR